MSVEQVIPDGGQGMVLQQGTGWEFNKLYDRPALLQAQSICMKLNFQGYRGLSVVDNEEELLR